MPYDLTKLKGSIPPLITPFKDEVVDYDAYAGLVEFQIDKGSHGILVNGTTSEPSTLTPEDDGINQSKIPYNGILCLPPKSASCTPNSN